jgi:hypothetical protein
VVLFASRLLPTIIGGGILVVLLDQIDAASEMWRADEPHGPFAHIGKLRFATVARYSFTKRTKSSVQAPPRIPLRSWRLSYRRRLPPPFDYAPNIRKIIRPGGVGVRSKGLPPGIGQQRAEIVFNACEHDPIRGA